MSQLLPRGEALTVRGDERTHSNSNTSRHRPPNHPGPAAHLTCLSRFFHSFSMCARVLTKTKWRLVPSTLYQSALSFFSSQHHLLDTQSMSLFRHWATVVVSYLFSFPSPNLRGAIFNVKRARKSYSSHFFSILPRTHDSSISKRGPPEKFINFFLLEINFHTRDCTFSPRPEPPTSCCDFGRHFLSHIKYTQGHMETQKLLSPLTRHRWCRSSKYHLVISRTGPGVNYSANEFRVSIDALWLTHFVSHNYNG